jgi:hypothetical protein
LAAYYASISLEDEQELDPPTVKSLMLKIKLETLRRRCRGKGGLHRAVPAAR